MELIKKLFVVGTVILISLFVSCSDDDEPSKQDELGTVTLNVQSSGSNTFATGGRSGGRIMGTVELTDFQISIRDITFKVDADDTLDIAFEGPYALDLLNGSDALSATIGSAEIPYGTYQEIRFKLHKVDGLGDTHPLFDRSIFIAGTIDGVPFEMWHDTGENLDIGKSTGIIVDSTGLDLVINFSIDQFLSSEVEIDLTLAVDNNDDGLIEIGPDDPDGNKDIADLLKENIKAAADLLDE